MIGRRVKCLWRAAATLGEAPTWNPDAGCLEFIDVPGGTLQQFWPGNGRRTRLEIANELGFLVRMPGGAACCGSGLRVLELSADRRRASLRLTLPGDAARLRLNDAGVNASGDLWTGSMDRQGRNPLGSIFMVRPDGSFEQVDEGYTIPNGFAMSRAGDRVFVADSPRRLIFAYPLASDGRPQSRQVWARIGEGDGFPDGMAVDSSGGLWVALYGSGRIRRFHPDGSVDRDVEIPVRNVTSLAIADDGRIYVTTAVDDAGTSARSWPWRARGGALFALRVS